MSRHQQAALAISPSPASIPPQIGDPQPEPQSNGPRMLQARNLVIGYGQDPIVKGVDFDALDGGITVLVGPNGCGKSTLLKSMARILPPSKGQVLLNGTPVHDTETRQVAKSLALLPQGPIAPEGLKVKELVAQGRFPHQTLLKQWSIDDTRAVTQAMEATNIVEFSERPVSDLSGGQRQRCWIAMVLAQETPVILLDEPTTFLDLKVQVDVMSLLRRIAETGRTLVVVLHELNVAAAFADHLVMMKDGEIVASGKPDDIMTSERLASVFGLDAQILTDPETGRPVCVPRIAGSAS